MQKWYNYTIGLPTPDSMVQWSWISLISSCLQRRVWLGSIDDPLFANNYIFFVSPPGVGKSLIISKVTDALRHWKLGDNQTIMDSMFTEASHKAAVESIAEIDKKAASGEEHQSNNVQSDIIQPSLFPVAPDATTYEALVLSFGKCFRRVNYPRDNKDGSKGVGVYGHSSLSFLLKELASLLRKRTDDTVTLLLGVYDCPMDYEYNTVSRQSDRIRKGCLNILGATNPGFMNKIFNDGLIDDAFLSRSIFVFATKNRKVVSKIESLTPEQDKMRQDIRDHILKLSVLYGEAKTSPETDKWMYEWLCDHEEHPERRQVKNPKLAHYYSRKLVHVKKTAMALHFGESTDMNIPLETFKKAISILDKEEKSMHLALLLEAKNNQAVMVRSIISILREGERNHVELSIAIFETMGLVDKDAMKEALDFLLETGQIKSDRREDKDTGQEVVWWKLR